MNTRLKQQLTTVIVLTVLACGIYWQTLPYPFVFDDKTSITDDVAIRMTSLEPGQVWRALTRGFAHNRPIANLTFAANYYFGEYRPDGYRLVNALIHLLTGLLIYQFCRRTLRLVDRDNCSPTAAHWLALAAAAIWLSHPLQTQAVTYIVQRMAALATMFFMAALNAWLSGRLATTPRRRWAWYAAAAAAWLLALGSKEIAVTLPLIIVLYEWFFLQNLERRWLSRRLPFAVGAGLLLVVIGILYLGLDPLARLNQSYATRSFTMGQRVITEFRVLVFYLSLIALPLPSRLNLDHHILPSTSLLSPPTTLLSLLFLLGLFGLACWQARGHRLLAFCVLWYFVNLALESSVVGLEMAFEHRLYLPSVGVMLALVYAAHRHLAVPSQGKLAAAALVVVCLAVGAWQRNFTWQDEVTLWRDAAAKSPNKPRPHNNLGQHLGLEGRTDEAIVAVRRALELDPDYAAAHSNLGILLRQQNKYEEAIEHYRLALAQQPDMASAHYNMGIALRRLNRLDEAIVAYRNAVRYKPDYADAYNNLCVALGLEGKYQEAVAAAERALELEPGMPIAQKNLAQYRALAATAAAGNLQTTVTLTPAEAAAKRIAEGEALMTRHDFAGALEKFKTAVELLPTSARAHNDLGAMYGQLGDLTSAAKHFEEAVRLDPDHQDAAANLKKALALIAAKQPGNAD